MDNFSFMSAPSVHTVDHHMSDNFALLGDDWLTGMDESGWCIQWPAAPVSTRYHAANIGPTPVRREALQFQNWNRISALAPRPSITEQYWHNIHGLHKRH
jgi:hypothetical protein